MMIQWVLRGVILLWASFFGLLAIRGLLNPAVFSDMFGIGIDGAAANTVRADLGSFFLVAAGGAAVGAVIPGWTRALLVPVALYGVALIGRFLGLASGDLITAGISQAMIIEALTVALMAGGWWILSRPVSTVAGVPETAVSADE